MKSRLILVLIATLAAQPAVLAAPSAQVKTDASQINSACMQDAQNTGCAGETVGKGLLKCMRSYKRTHRSYKFSDGCKAALKQLRADRRAGK